MSGVRAILVNVQAEKMKLDSFRDLVYSLCRQAVKNLQKELQTYPAYQYYPWSSNTTNVKAQGGYHSERQRLFVLASMARGDWGTSPPYYNRTDAMKKSWKYKETIGSRVSHFKVIHDRRYHRGRGGYVQGSGYQHWRMENIGWPTQDSVVDDYWPRELRIMRGAISSWRP